MGGGSSECSPGGTVSKTRTPEESRGMKGHGFVAAVHMAELFLGKVKDRDVEGVRSAISEVRENFGNEAVVDLITHVYPGIDEDDNANSFDIIAGGHPRTVSDPKKLSDSGRSLLTLLVGELERSGADWSVVLGHDHDFDLNAPMPRDGQILLRNFLVEAGITTVAERSTVSQPKKFRRVEIDRTGPQIDGQT